MSDKLNSEALLGGLLELSSRLRAASAQLQGPAGAQLPSTIATVFAFYKFVAQVFPNEPEYCMPINAVLYALLDVANGQKPPLFKPVKGRRGVPFSESIFRAAAAALMEFYQQSGIARKVAARDVAIELDRMGYRNEGREITADNVENWRDEMREEGGTPAADRYLYILKELGSGFPKEPKKAAQFLFNALPGIHSPDSYQLP